MSNVAPYYVTRSLDATYLPPGVVNIIWTPLTSTNTTGTGAPSAHFNDKSVQTNGTFGAGGTFVWEGSNDSTDGSNGVWIGLTDPGSTAISFTANGQKQVLQNTLWVRPRLSAGGDGTTAITCTCTAMTQKAR